MRKRVSPYRVAGCLIIMASAALTGTLIFYLVTPQ